jgi:hypothetical protein
MTASSTTSPGGPFNAPAARPGSASQHTGDGKPKIVAVTPVVTLPATDAAELARQREGRKRALRLARHARDSLRFADGVAEKLDREACRAEAWKRYALRQRELAQAAASMIEQVRGGTAAQHRAIAEQRDALQAGLNEIRAALDAAGIISGNLAVRVQRLSAERNEERDHRRALEVNLHDARRDLLAVQKENEALRDGMTEVRTALAQAGQSSGQLVERIAHLAAAHDEWKARALKAEAKAKETASAG